MRKPTTLVIGLRATARAASETAVLSDMRISFSLRLTRLELFDETAVPRDAVEEVRDTDALVDAVDRRTLRVGHPERREAVDPRPDAVEVAGVRGREHDVRHRDRPGEHLPDRRLEEGVCRVVRRRHRAGL